MQADSTVVASATYGTFFVLVVLTMIESALREGV